MDDQFLATGETLFGASPNPRYYYDSPAARQALTGLIYGIRARKGFVALTGEPGTGKTTLLLRLLDDLNQQGYPAAFVFTPRLNPLEFLHFVLADFQIEHDPSNKAGMLLRFNQKLLAIFRQNRTAVLIVDEAQASTADLLEEIRLLTNLETATEKLLQIVIAGRPELEEMLKRTELRQLHQRIAIWERTQPLSFDETRGYIAARLGTVRVELDRVFAPETTAKIWEVSRGVPRVINQLCEAALVGARATRQLPISEERINQLALQFNLGLSERDIEAALGNLMRQLPAIPTRSTLRDRVSSAGDVPAISAEPVRSVPNEAPKSLPEPVIAAAIEKLRSLEPKTQSPAKEITTPTLTPSVRMSEPGESPKAAVAARHAVPSPQPEPPRKVNGALVPPLSSSGIEKPPIERPAPPAPPKKELTIAPPVAIAPPPVPPRLPDPVLTPVRKPAVSNGYASYPVRNGQSGTLFSSAAPKPQSGSKLRWLWGVLSLIALSTGIAFYLAHRPHTQANSVSTINPINAPQQAAPSSSVTPPSAASPITPPAPQPAKQSVKQAPPAKTSSQNQTANHHTKQPPAREAKSASHTSTTASSHAKTRPASSNKSAEAKSTKAPSAKSALVAQNSAVPKPVQEVTPPVIMSKVDFSATPAGAQIFIDGKSYGPTPVHATISPGNHSYHITAPGMKAISGKFTVAAGEVFGQNFGLTPAAPPASKWNLQIITDPPSASLYLDGAPVNHRTPASLHVSPGHHTLIIFLGGYKPERREVNVPASGTANVTLALQRQ